MEWNYGNLPNETRRYLVSVMLQRPHQGTEVFKYIARLIQRVRNGLSMTPLLRSKVRKQKGRLLHGAQKFQYF